MTNKNDKNFSFYQFADLSGYSFKQRLLIRLGGLMFYLLVFFIGKTTRFEVEGRENLKKIEEKGEIPIYVFWHNRIFLATYFFRYRSIVVMSSQSFDAEYVARFIQRFGYGVIKGSSTRGGVSALVGMIRLMKEGLPAGFSIDGPKGPKYVVKPGAVLLAKKTSNPILPFIIEAKNYWEIKSWDNLQIPKPFSRAKVIISEPIYVEKNVNEEELTNKTANLQKSLDELVKIGEQWRKPLI